MPAATNQVAVKIQNNGTFVSPSGKMFKQPAPKTTVIRAKVSPNTKQG